MESIEASITAPATQQEHETEAQVLQTCAKAGVSCIGIQSGFGLKADLVLFQPTVTTLAVPLAEFADPEKAIELIKAKLAQSGKLTRDFVELLVVAMLAFAIGLATATVICLRQ